jgi:hypothetical protein
MAAQVVPLFQRLRAHHDWTPRELAQFYRVESALIQAGLKLETDRGLTDEGDPWFVFCRADGGEVFIHFARIDGVYVAVGAALEQVIHGKDFPTLVQEMLAAQAWAMAKARDPSGRSNNVFLHPSALLIALVGAAFFHSGDAKAADTGHAATERAGTARRFVLPILAQDGSQGAALDAADTSTILSSVLIALNQLSPMATPTADATPVSPASAAFDFVAPPPALSPIAYNGADHSLPASAPAADPAAAQISLELLQAHQIAQATIDFALSAQAAPITANALASAAIPIADTVVTPHVDIAAAPVSAVLLLQTSSTDAAQVIQASDILSYVGPLQSSAPVQPPAVLSDQIHNGEHVVVLKAPDTGAADTTAPTPSVPDHTIPPTTSGSAGGAPDTGATGAAPELQAGSPVITAAITLFASEVSALDVAYSGREVILYDAALLHPVGPGVQIESVTFNFADGSSISLVGTASELQGLHLPFTAG